MVEKDNEEHALERRNRASALFWLRTARQSGLDLSWDGRRRIMTSTWRSDLPLETRRQIEGELDRHWAVIKQLLDRGY